LLASRRAAQQGDFSVRLRFDPAHDCTGNGNVGKNVHGAVDPEEYVRRVREWAVATWEAWRDYHDVARQWVEQATGRWLPVVKP